MTITMTDVFADLFARLNAENQDYGLNILTRCKLYQDAFISQPDSFKRRSCIREWKQAE